jgi:hypothetical protein
MTFHFFCKIAFLHKAAFHLRGWDIANAGEYSLRQKSILRAGVAIVCDTKQLNMGACDMGNEKL